MTKERIKKDGAWLLLSGVIAGEGIFLVDVAYALCQVRVSAKVLLIALAAIAAAVFFAGRGSRARKAVLGAIPTAVILLGLGIWAGWKPFSERADYADVDTGKTGIYGDQRIMLVVPHQDDDLNLLGGVIEEYVAYGSEVYCVFVTNGDYFGIAETRYKEAIALFDFLGVPEDHVFFLGYGDQWDPEGVHLYNAEPGTVMTSYIGKTAVYGTKNHPAYNEGADYTVDNLLADLRNVILQYRPDVIFCTDYDFHIDHKATTLAFDKVMGRILQSGEGYTPVVYKGYAYNTAWYAEKDYYAENILSTQNVFAEPYDQQPAVYRWEDRVRLPVDAATLSRSLLGSGGYEAMAIYESQDAVLHAAGVLNGDKVVWKRETTSLTYRAGIETSSGDASVLNDFMLTENFDISDEERLPYDGVWIPEDGERMVAVTLEEAADLSSIALYDHPSPEHNVLNARIEFDDGTAVDTGPLDPGGAETAIPVNRKNVESFQIRITDSEGTDAGLTEVEAYREEPAENVGFVKLMDGKGNYAYDYIVEKDGTQTFAVYTYGTAPEVNGESYTVTTDNPNCAVGIDADGRVEVRCPRGEETVITLTDGRVSDSILVRNPGWLERLAGGVLQNMERLVRESYRSGAVDEMMTAKIVNRLSSLLDRLG